MPIFWPVLTNTWVGRIFVTREVCVTSEERIVVPDRYNQELEDHLGGRMTPNSSSQRAGTLSPTGSHVEIYGKRSMSAMSMGMDGERGKDLEAHYQDSYILQQVDPLRANNGPQDSGHRAEATSNGPCTKDPMKGLGVEECPKAGGWMALK